MVSNSPEKGSLYSGQMAPLFRCWEYWVTPTQRKEYFRQLVIDEIAISVMIWGPPGIGKSSIVQQIADESDRQFIDVRLSQLAPTDLRGLPVPKEGITHWFPLNFYLKMAKVS
jgi:MoxR-like ATPase